jgi:hypothetical protein
MFYAADILNVQYRTNLKTSPHQESFGTRPECVRPLEWNAGYMFEQISVRIANSMLKGKLQYNVSGDQRWTTGLVYELYVLYVPGRLQSTFVSTNNVVCNKCGMAKDSPNIIDNGEVALEDMYQKLAFRVSTLFLIRLTPTTFYAWTTNLSNQ